jgi:transposase-like protein
MRKRYTAQFKAEIVEEILKEEKTIGQIASEQGIHPNQLNRWKGVALEGLPSLFSNAGHSLLRAAMRQLNMPTPPTPPTPGCFARVLRKGASQSVRAYHRTLKLARTTPARAAAPRAGARVADLAGAERIETAHLAEAVQYRPRWQV